MKSIFLKDGKFDIFRLKITRREDNMVYFEVFEIFAWSECNEPVDEEKYLEGEIKWDGCSHVWIRDDGYIHLCGLKTWKSHCAMMEWLYKTVFAMMGDHRDKSEDWT